MTEIHAMIRSQAKSVYIMMTGDTYDSTDTNFTINVVRSGIGFVAFVDNSVVRTFVQGPACATAKEAIEALHVTTCDALFLRRGDTMLQPGGPGVVATDNGGLYQQSVNEG
ncbi:hypothetical protein LTR37_004654 [Vermiconidia calcicola]|uniref:Uncharacterized protein n=1 Tax=Vermiconidia calcicola TaxID=1690605 RepID=A0ACC3NLU1_9PEZI|nr:hypothetical protein LTR37_004654 [Vermiconidia calcicola]